MILAIRTMDVRFASQQQFRHQRDRCMPPTLVPLTSSQLPFLHICCGLILLTSCCLCVTPLYAPPVPCWPRATLAKLLDAACSLRAVCHHCHQMRIYECECLGYNWIRFKGVGVCGKGDMITSTFMWASCC